MKTDFAGYMDTVVSTTYDLFNRKLFSLPKVMLLPVIMARQPKMMAQIFPFIFVADWCKGKAVAYMTSRIEKLQKETQELQSIRSKVESFDMKNAELLQRAGTLRYVSTSVQYIIVVVRFHTLFWFFCWSLTFFSTMLDANHLFNLFYYEYNRSRSDGFHETKMGRVDGTGADENDCQRLDRTHKRLLCLD
jgi:hypothetical protein